LDGVDDIVEIPDVPALRPASLTLETWVLFFSSGGNQHIIAKPLGSSTADSFVLWYENGSLRGAITDMTGGSSSISSPFAPVVGRWYHVAFTFDEDSKEQWLYLDGMAVATGISSRRVAYDDHPVQLGGDIDNSSLAWLLQGRIDEAAIYNRPLGPAEIASLFKAGSRGKTAVGPYFNTPPDLPDAVLGYPYAQTIAAVRGSVPINFSLANGSLPGGLTLSSAGVLAGTPTNIGSYAFVVRATDSAGMTADQTFNLEVFESVRPAAGLISWWRAENNGLDSFGANHGLVTNGTTYAHGQVGQAFLLDGVNDYIQITDAASLRPASITLESWVQFSATGTRIVMGKPVGTGASDSYQIYVGGGTLGAFVGDAVGAGTALTIPFAPVLGRWYHVAYTFDGSSKQQILYLDGVVAASGLGNKNIGYDAQPVLLGCDTENGVRSFFLAGRIDEAAIYGRPLRAEEIALLYAAGPAGKSAAPSLNVVLTGTNTLVVSWPLSAAGFTLQQNTDLGTPSWTPPAELVATNGPFKFIVVNPAASRRFYRLLKP
jgi:hypothetical protein